MQTQMGIRDNFQICIPIARTTKRELIQSCTCKSMYVLITGSLIQEGGDSQVGDADAHAEVVVNAMDNHLYSVSWEDAVLFVSFGVPPDIHYLALV